MGGVTDVINKVSGKLFGQDNSEAASAQALAIQKDQAAKVRQEAQSAAAEQAAAEAQQRKKKANVVASGRESTILAGENSSGKTRLGG